MRSGGAVPLEAKTGSPAAVGVVRVAGDSGLCGDRVAGRGGRCVVVLACRPSSPFRLGPFEAVTEIGAGAPCRVTPVAAACACVSLLYWPGSGGRRARSHLVGGAAAGGGRA